MSRKKERDAVYFLNDQMKLAEKMLTESERGRLYAALRKYSIERKLYDTTLESHGWIAIYEMMCDAQDKAIQQYELTCERNRINALKRAQPLAAFAATGSDGSQYNIIKSNQNKYNAEPALDGQEESGVPGIEWL